MRTTVDIPDAIYRELKVRAAREGTTIKALILRGVTIDGQRPEGTEDLRANVSRQKPKYPLLNSKEPGSLKLGEEGVYEYIPFP